MSLLIPQSALDSFVCHCCHKYLSVTPVKVFPNRRIKCGRCVSQDDDDGAISMYNEVAKRSLFKCINHYEGCKALLNTTEVLQHETTCESKEYVCPVCNDVFPSYLIYKHFTKKHKQLVLKKTYFVIQPSDYTDLNFLYRYENYILFVKYAHEMLHDDNITRASINFFLIGDSKTVKTVDLVLTFGKTTIEKKVNCEVHPSHGGINDLRIELDLKENNLTVGFFLEVPDSDVRLQMAAVATNTEKCSYLSIEYLSMLLLSLYFKNRMIYLDYHIMNKLSEEGILRHIITNTISKFEVNDIKLTCFMCSLPNFCHNNSEILFLRKYEKYYFLCYFCQSLGGWRNLYIGASYLENASYYCKWMCGLHLPYHNIELHENDCEKQVSSPCPVSLCEHRCKSFEILQHFEVKHPQLRKPVFCDYGNNYLSLNPSDSPINQVIVVSNISIVMELKWNSSAWEITLTCKILNARPRMVILDSIGQFVSFIKQNGSCKKLDKILYLCYLADPEEEKFEKNCLAN